jgi:hypothetical protein
VCERERDRQTDRNNLGTLDIPFSRKGELCKVTFIYLQRTTHYCI